MKATAQQLEFLLGEMRHAQEEHPKANVYYDWEDNEIRITYPLPRDFDKFKSIGIDTGSYGIQELPRAMSLDEAKEKYGENWSVTDALVGKINELTQQVNRLRRLH